MKIQIVSGAQFGSEAKGHVTQQLIKRSPRQYIANVRVGGPNAGHTAYTENGEKFAFRQLPVGAITAGVTPVIAQGSEIDLPVLLAEMQQRREWIDRAGMDPVNYPTVLVDSEATLLTDHHKSAESQAQMVNRIGSTGKGIGAARADRLMRTAPRVRDHYEVVMRLQYEGVLVVQTAPLLRGLPRQAVVIIEGTQGYGLGLHAGHYPQCTSGDCTAIDFLAQVGLSPFGHEVEPWIVARMFPIRVAGNSGPLYRETSWAELGLPEERTTVTQKVRRVGHWDDDLFMQAVEANGGSDEVRVALTMIDQRWPEARGATTIEALPRECLDWIGNLYHKTNARIDVVTTSPTTCVWLDV